MVESMRRADTDQPSASRRGWTSIFTVPFLLIEEMKGEAETMSLNEEVQAISKNDLERQLDNARMHLAAKQTKLSELISKLTELESSFQTAAVLHGDAARAKVKEQAAQLQGEIESWEVAVTNSKRLVNRFENQLREAKVLGEFDRLSGEILDIAQQMGECALKMAELVKRGEDSAVMLADFLTTQFPNEPAFSGMKGGGPGTIAEFFSSSKRASAARELQNVVKVVEFFKDRIGIVRAAIQNELFMESFRPRSDADHGRVV